MRDRAYMSLVDGDGIRFLRHRDGSIAANLPDGSSIQVVAWITREWAERTVADLQALLDSRSIPEGTELLGAEAATA